MEGPRGPSDAFSTFVESGSSTTPGQLVAALDPPLDRPGPAGGLVAGCTENFDVTFEDIDIEALQVETLTQQ